MCETNLRIHPHVQEEVEPESSTTSISALGVPAVAYCYFLHDTGFSWNLWKPDDFTRVVPG